MKPIIDTICTPDGVHFLAPGYHKIGELIAEVFQPRRHHLAGNVNIVVFKEDQVTGQFAMFA